MPNRDEEMERYAERRKQENRYGHQAQSGSGTGSGNAAALLTDRSTVENVKEGLIRAGADPADAAEAAAPHPAGATGIGSGLQSGGTKPAGGRRGGLGSIGTGGGQTGPGSGTAGATRSPAGK